MTDLDVRQAEAYKAMVKNISIALLIFLPIHCVLLTAAMADRSGSEEFFAWVIGIEVGSAVLFMITGALNNPLKPNIIPMIFMIIFVIIAAPLSILPFLPYRKYKAAKEEIDFDRREREASAA